MKTIPWKHQGKEYEETMDIKASALLWGMRTGKSKPVLDQMSNHYLSSGINGGLVLAPNGVHYNWTHREAPKHIWDEVPYTVFPWITSKSAKVRSKKDLKAHYTSVDKFLDYDGFKLLSVSYGALAVPRAQKFIRQFMRACKNRVYFTADESHHLGRPNSQQSSLARPLAELCEIRRILSGTAILNSPLQAFSQFEMLERGALGYEKFKQFRKQYAVYETRRMRKSGRRYQALSHYINLDELKVNMANWSSVVLREDVDDMPDLIMTDNACMLSEAQARAYRDMVEYEVLVGDEVVQASEGAGRLSKFQQILGGFVYNQFGEVVNIDSNPPRLDAMMDEVLGTLPGKFIIWCRFTEDIVRVTKRLRKEGLNIVQLYGKMNEGDRERSKDRFQNDSLVDGLVGQPQVGSEGIDLSKAEAIINYSHSHNAITRNQAIERGTEKGGGSVAIIDLYTPGTVEEVVLKCLADKVSVADRISGTGLQEVLELTSI